MEKEELIKFIRRQMNQCEISKINAIKRDNKIMIYKMTGREIAYKEILDGINNGYFDLKL